MHVAFTGEFGHHTVSPRQLTSEASPPACPAPALHSWWTRPGCECWSGRRFRRMRAEHTAWEAARPPPPPPNGSLGLGDS